MSKLWWVIVALAVIGGAVYFYSNNQTAEVPEQVADVVEESTTTEESTTMEEGTTVEVSYTDEGFVAASIEIEAGDTVTFANNSERLMWVASAVHPTHLEYPGFDQLEGVEAGGEYSFTFTEVGEWNYHNHLFPEHIGTVVVVEATVEEEAMEEDATLEEEVTTETETEIETETEVEVQ